MNSYHLILAILGVWRITHLLQAEDGPWDLVVRLRRSAGSGSWGGLLDCFYCLSLWIAAPFAAALGADLGERLLLWPALSAAAICLERLIAPSPPGAAPYWKEEDADALLRPDEASPALAPPAGH